MIRIRSRCLFLLSLVLLITPAAFGQVAVSSGEAGLSAERQAAFEKVWSTVNEKHYDPTFGGVDWKAVREAYLPKAKAADSDAAFHQVLRDMLGELKLSHFNIFPPEPAIATGNERDGVVGVDIVWLDGAPVVRRVDAGSPAERAGVRAGYVFKKIDGKLVEETLKPLGEALQKRSTSAAMRSVALERTAASLLAGKPGTVVKAEFLDGEDRPVAVELARVKYAGEMSPPFGNFGPQRVNFESKLLPENIGYIRFNMWVMPQAAKIRAAIREFAAADGIIFDLRGNPGGVGGLAAGVAGQLSDKRLPLGSMTSRGGTMNLIGYPQTEPFLGKIVVLTDHGSASTSEMFAAGLQENGRGKVVGGTSAGAILPSVFELLPTGYMFQYAVSDYRSPTKVLVEGRGVQPDLKVDLTRASLLAGSDAQLQAAIRLIKGKE